VALALLPFPLSSNKCNRESRGCGDSEKLYHGLLGLPGRQDKGDEDTWQHFCHSHLFPFGWDRTTIVEGAAFSTKNLTRLRPQSGMVPANDVLGLQAFIFLSHEEGHMQAFDTVTSVLKQF
jgi:hypothetical protein